MSPFLRLLVGSVLLLCFWACMSGVFSRVSAATPEEELANAFQLWQNAMFDESLITLNRIVARKDLSKGVKRDAYLLLGQSQLGLDSQNTTEAREAFCQAVKADPKWDLKSGSIDLADAEVKLYAQAREKCKPKGISKPLLAGIAAAGVGGIALLLGGGGGDDGGTPPDPLDDFPGVPPQ